MRRFAVLLVALALAATPAVAGTRRHATPRVEVALSEFALPAQALDTLRADFVEQTLATHEPGTWAPLRMNLSDKQLAMMGLPASKTLRAMDFSTPTAFNDDGSTTQLDAATVSFAGTGYFGIRPGAWILVITDDAIGWCSAAQVYGSPGAYDISTAGHCGKTGDTATVIGAVGNNTPVLVDFGTFATSHDGGIGDDWALIDIAARFQHLVTPTMAFWGGPRGTFTKTGAVASLTFAKDSVPAPSVTPDPDPFLPQGIAHYGHGTGIGAGGTPRVGTAIAWGANHFMFFGAITPGDSGSGSNTTGGDSVGAVSEAAGINTHIHVDPLMRKGVGVIAGTRVSEVGARMANGQLVGYPAPVPILP